MCGGYLENEEISEDLNSRIISAFNFYLSDVVYLNLTDEEIKEVDVDHLIQEFSEAVKRVLSENKSKLISKNEVDDKNGSDNRMD